ncbi:hypothetical protein MPTK1_4g05130 [Marchantia polymorpha subsp. ruderalis]|nr:hypothetical protein MARPO_0087s0076 [Marchantia polymorpha]BBN07626.1 hypothetical protein Mp_4g05130 [Marchantia polymorpha subsp. ruderalis]|eukprot:PTQ33646.1 hypothetical protein MARPO_0087s0076 [Marchantia polymorpha]
MEVDGGKSSNSKQVKDTKGQTNEMYKKTYTGEIVFSSLCIILIAGGWVPKEDIIFSILTTLYIFIMQKKVFTAVTPYIIPGMFPGKVFAIYLSTMSVLGLLFPLVYLIGAYILGDMTGFEAAVPSIFLLLVQCLSENYTYTRVSFSLLIRVLVPVMYNARRIFTLWTWALYIFGDGVDPEFSTGYWLLCGQILAAVNVIIWNYNLWCFLIPIFLPGSMRAYYKIEQEQQRS